eukprot:g4582.t1
MSLSHPLGWFAAGLLALPAYYLWVHGHGGGTGGSPTSFRVVYVTAPDAAVAAQLAEAAVKEKVASCVNILPQVRSVYQWEGKLEKSTEAMLVIKSSVERLDALEQLVKSMHPYDVPEFLVLPVAGGSSEYLQFLGQGMDL